MSRLLLLALVLLSPTWAQGATFWDEDFNDGTNQFGLAVGSGVVQIDTATKYAGAGSARYMFDLPQTGSCLPGHANYIDCGGYFDATFTPTNNLWRRFWMRLSPGFTVATPSTKITKTGSASTNDWLVMGYNQTSTETRFQLTMDVQVSGQAGLWGGTARHDGSWQCFEIYQALNSPGASNGVYELYLDGTRAAYYTNVKWRPDGDTSPFNFARLYRQYGSGDMHLDNYAVGDTRIGCGTTPVGDTTPPSPPSTPTLTVSGGGQISVSWTNGTDTYLAGTTILRCTGAACTPAATLTTINSTTTISYADTGLTSGTTYGYALRNFDASGNTSTVSATAYATTSSSYKSTTITDSFNRADSTELGASWDPGYTTFYGANTNLVIVSNQLRVSATNADSIETHNTAIANDQWAQITFSSLVTADANIRAPGVLVRANAPGNLTGYACRVWIYNGSPHARIEEWNGLVSHVPLVDESTTTWLTGDKLRCEAEGATLRLYQIRGTTETLVLSTTDATYASGRVGLQHYIAAAGTTNDIQIDNFTAGEFSVSAPTPPAITGVTSGSRTSTTVTYTGTPTTIRIATENGSKVELLSAFPAGVYTFPAEVLATMTDFFCMFASDTLGVENTTGYTCGTVPYTYDQAAPVLSNPLPTAELPNGTASTQIIATIDKTTNVVCRYDTTDIAYTAMQTASAVSLVGLSASATVTGLNTGANLFYMGCVFTDITGTEHTSANTTFTVTVAASTADTTVPSTVTNLMASPLSNSQVELAWPVATDNVAVDGYNVYMSIGSGNTTYILEQQTASATRTVVNLQPSAVHNFVVRARDTSQNLSAADSNVATVTTTALPDVTPPSTVTGLVVDGVYKNSIALSWAQPLDDRGAPTVTIEYCSGVDCGDTESNFGVLLSHYALQQLVVSLSAGTSYSFRIMAVDAAGNRAAAYSDTVTATTATTGLSLPRTAIPFGQDRTAVGTARTTR